MLHDFLFRRIYFLFYSGFFLPPFAFVSFIVFFFLFSLYFSSKLRPLPSRLFNYIITLSWIFDLYVSPFTPFQTIKIFARKDVASFTLQLDPDTEH